MKSLKDALVHVNGDDWLEVLWRIVMIMGVNVSDCFWYWLTWGYPGLEQLQMAVKQLLLLLLLNAF